MPDSYPKLRSAQPLDGAGLPSATGPPSPPGPLARPVAHPAYGSTGLPGMRTRTRNSAPAHGSGSSSRSREVVM